MYRIHGKSRDDALGCTRDTAHTSFTMTLRISSGSSRSFSGLFNFGAIAS